MNLQCPGIRLATVISVLLELADHVAESSLDLHARQPVPLLLIVSFDDEQVVLDHVKELVYEVRAFRMSVQFVDELLRFGKRSASVPFMV